MPAPALALLLSLVVSPLIPAAAAQDAEAPEQGGQPAATDGGASQQPPDPAGAEPPTGEDPPDEVAGPPPDPEVRAEAERQAREIEPPEGLSREDYFGSGRRLELSLEAAMRVALGNDIGLQIEEANTDVALYDARGSWGAFDFVFSANAAVTDSEQQQRTELDGADVLTVNTQGGGIDLSRATEIGGQFALTYDRNNVQTNNAFAVINPSTTDVLRLSYTQPLLRGFGVDYATSLQEQAEVQYELQRERLRNTRQQLLLSVSNAYWDLVLALQQLDVVNSGLDLALEQLERDRRVFEAGLGTEVDVLQSEAQVATRIELLLQADVSVKAAEDALKQLLFPGTDESTWETRLVPATPLPDEVATATLPDWTETLLTALDYRSEVRQRQLEIEVAEIGLERALSERMPQLDLGLTAASQGFSGDPAEAFTSTLGFDFPTYTASLSFSSPIQNRSARAAVHSARAQVRRARLGYDQTESQIVADVRDALRQLGYQSERVRAADRSLEATRRQLEAEQARNREGISTTFEVLQLQDQFVQAMNSERSARVDYMKARVRLRASVGTLGEILE